MRLLYKQGFLFNLVLVRGDLFVLVDSILTYSGRVIIIYNLSNCFVNKKKQNRLILKIRQMSENYFSML